MKEKESSVRAGRAARPPQLAGATEAPVVLVGEPASVSLTIPARSRSLVAAAAADRTHQLFVGVEDIEAEQDPGLAYAVYLAGPGGQRRHIGNLSFFGIHALNDPDRPHLGAPGFRHTFDASGAVDSLRREGAFDAGSITVTFEPIRVLPPLGRGARQPRLKQRRQHRRSGSAASAFSHPDASWGAGCDRRECGRCCAGDWSGRLRCSSALPGLRCCPRLMQPHPPAWFTCGLSRTSWGSTAAMLDR